MLGVSSLSKVLSLFLCFSCNFRVVHPFFIVFFHFFFLQFSLSFLQVSLKLNRTSISLHEFYGFKLEISMVFGSHLFLGFHLIFQHCFYVLDLVFSHFVRWFFFLLHFHCSSCVLSLVNALFYMFLPFSTV